MKCILSSCACASTLSTGRITERISSKVVSDCTCDASPVYTNVSDVACRGRGNRMSTPAISPASPVLLTTAS